MVVTEILLLRHGHRIAWTLDPTTGKYTSNHPFPTKLPADPPLASHGVRQAVETGDYLGKELKSLVEQDRLRVYSSLFYRCLETLRPTITQLRSSSSAHSDLNVRGERGIGEWFGKAWFLQPVPAEPTRLKREFFEFVDDEYESRVIPSDHGERIHELHDRVAHALEVVIRDVNAEYETLGRGSDHVTLLLCGHAAQIICSGRVLTGRMPDDPDTQDFNCFTCGISKFVRRGDDDRQQRTIPTTASKWEDWRTNGGVAGGWDCVLNSWCGHLSQGEERGWHFHGDESFDSYGSGSIRTEDGGVDDDNNNNNNNDQKTASSKL